MRDARVANLLGVASAANSFRKVQKIWRLVLTEVSLAKSRQGSSKKVFVNSKPNDRFKTSTPAELAADLEFVRRVLVRDEKAVDQMLVRLECVPRFISSMNRRSGSRLNPDEQNDLIQDVLFVVWRKLDQFAGASRFESWAFRVCRLEYLNALRRKRRDTAASYSDTDPSCATARDGQDGTDVALRSQRSEWIEKSLVRLPPEEAEIVVLKHYEQLTFEAIASRLQCPSNSVKTRYYRAMKRMKTLMSGTDGEAES